MLWGRNSWKSSAMRYVVSIVYLPHMLFYFSYEPWIFFCLRSNKVRCGNVNFRSMTTVSVSTTYQWNRPKNIFENNIRPTSLKDKLTDVIFFRIGILPQGARCACATTTLPSRLHTAAAFSWRDNSTRCVIILITWNLRTGICLSSIFQYH